MVIDGEWRLDLDALPRRRERPHDELPLDAGSHVPHVIVVVRTSWEAFEEVLRALTDTVRSDRQYRRSMRRNALEMS